MLCLQHFSTQLKAVVAQLWQLLVYNAASARDFPVVYSYVFVQFHHA